MDEVVSAPARMVPPGPAVAFDEPASCNQLTNYNPQKRPIAIEKMQLFIGTPPQSYEASPAYGITQCYLPVPPDTSERVPP